MIQKVPGFDMDVMGLPLRFDGERPPLPGGTPALGEHNAAIKGGRPPGVTS